MNNNTKIKYEVFGADPGDPLQYILENKDKLTSKEIDELFENFKKNFPIDDFI